MKILSVVPQHAMDHSMVQNHLHNSLGAHCILDKEMLSLDGDDHDHDHGDDDGGLAQSILGKEVLSLPPVFTSHFLPPRSP